MDAADDVEVHGNHADSLLLGAVGNPAGVGIGIQSTLEILADILAEFGVAEEQSDVGLGCRAIHEVRTAPTQNVFRALGDDATEAHVGYLGTNLVVVDKTGVDEGARLVFESGSPRH